MTDRYHIDMPHWPVAMQELPPEGQIERTRTLLNALGNPQETLPPIVHVAGTNGKGSTIAILRSVLQAAGYRVHAYTSPHIHRFNERIMLANRIINDAVLHECIELTRQAAADQPVSFFEGTTAAAFLAFAQVPADILLLETGLGGLLDPTNVIEQKRACIITSLSLDHTRLLGDALESIALHKLGILRPDTPAIIGKQPDSLNTLIREYGEHHHLSMVRNGLHWTVESHGFGMKYQDTQGSLILPKPALLGDHQIQNAGNAIAALRQMPEYTVTQEQMEQGLSQVIHPGRMELLYPQPFHRMTPEALPDIEVWFDGGHNPAGAQAIAQLIREWKGYPVHLIFGTTRGKYLPDMLAPFKDVVTSVTAVSVAAEPNAYSAQAIVDAASQLGIEVTAAENAVDAINRIANQNQSARILVFGSFYLRVELAADLF